MRDRDGRGVLLDRDGVVNRKPPEGSSVTCWDDFEFLPGVLQALAEVTEAGLQTVVITNQRGIAREAISECVLNQIHDRMQAEIAAAGGRVDAVYYCPHEEGCDCRKPRTGMLERAARELRLDLSKAVVIGDRLSDMEAGAAVGATTVLVLCDVDEPPAWELADHVAFDLASAVRWMLEVQPHSDCITHRLQKPADAGISRWAL